MFLLCIIDRLPRGHRLFLILNLVMIGGTLREIIGENLFSFYTRHSLVVINFLVVLAFLLFARLKKLS